MRRADRDGSPDAISISASGTPCRTSTSHNAPPFRTRLPRAPAALARVFCSLSWSSAKSTGMAGGSAGYRRELWKHELPTAKHANLRVAGSSSCNPSKASAVGYVFTCRHARAGDRMRTSHAEMTWNSKSWRPPLPCSGVTARPLSCRRARDKGKCGCDSSGLSSVRGGRGCNSAL